MTTLAPNVVADIAQRRLTAGNQRTTGLQGLANTYNQNISNLGQYQTDMQQKINDQMGSQGLFNSGIRMNELGKMQQSVGQKRGFLDTQYAQGKTGLENSYQNAMNDINSYQTGQYQQQAQSDLAYQQQQAALQFQQQQAAQAQHNWEVEQWNAAAARNQAAQQAAPPAQQGPSQADIDAWNRQVWINAVNQQNLVRWLQAVQAQNATRDEFAGSGNAISGNGVGGGARFK